MPEIFDAIGRSFGYLRVKNGFSSSDASSYGYRAILCNVRHAPHPVLTCSDVFGDAHEALWEGIGEALDPSGLALQQTRHCIEALKEVHDQPLAICAEVQLVYGPYFEQGRKLSHSYYRVVRCKTPFELVRDLTMSGKNPSERLLRLMKQAGSLFAEVASARASA